MGALGLRWTVGSSRSEEYWENPWERPEVLKCSTDPSFPRTYFERLFRAKARCGERLAERALSCPREARSGVER